MKKQKETIEPTAVDACDRVGLTSSEWLAFIAPGDTFRHPRDVILHPTLSVAEKRAILAWWASDIHAVDSSPWLRCLPGSASQAVPVGDVFAALAELDSDFIPEPADGSITVPFREPHRDPFPEPHWLRGSWRDDGDDDDPPPCPATIMRQPKSPRGGVEAIAAAA
ncbi:hypothetical protein [Methylobacterium gnaphalii]|uniref:Uncharacterized protein n=1 Tax=Methylobacterium gnaphalii TaxID=1010610 RepID=A0A512JIG7_9HYPH|nr:hypothetical protein [Methylobacterium gnaphalii]GEP09749.1 hypothetical protein MGN01_15940 [Methylobacterium gnaphalii]GJD70852.1 hypothetical protein MMMDOFMJ_3805 [Methylobacterium gnaphalii]GLS51375.1 hypothetical protein GCM10007885_42320 [Methylobacterium gnaphalii]